MAVRGDIRNVAIVAHVDHGKTTLVNAMLQQSHVFNEREEVPDRVMDSNDLEREKGITILAKNTVVEYTGRWRPSTVTRTASRSTSSTPPATLISVARSSAASRWSTASCCSSTLPKAAAADPFRAAQGLEAKLPVILCVNKVDRPDARIEEVVSESTDLLLGLAQDVIEEGVDLDLDHLLDLPVVYCAAKAGYASVNQPENGGLPDNDNLEPLFEDIIKYIPPPNTRRARRCRRTSPTSTPPTSSDDSAWSVSTTARWRRARPTACPAWTVPSRTSASSNCCARRAWSALPSNPPAPVTSSPSRASTTS